MIFETVVAVKDGNDEIRGYLIDGMYNVPVDAGNRDYTELMKRVADGTVVVA